MAGAMKPLRVYADTSVLGGCLDEEFAADSQHLVRQASSGRLILLISDAVIAELADAPSAVRAILQRLPTGCIEAVPLTSEVTNLRDAYISAGIVSERWLGDATHVAAATVARADAIASWNFRHIVRLDKIKAYNQVNLANGYGILTIISPQEVRTDDTE